MKHLSALALACFLALSGPGWAAAPLNVVAAENFYGDIARQIGGPEVKVTSILSNPDQDPHLFEASASVARNISGAQIVVYSGIDYDPWMEKLLGAARSSNRKVIVAAELIGKKTGDNPHICTIRPPCWPSPRRSPTTSPPPTPRTRPSTRTA